MTAIRPPAFPPIRTPEQAAGPARAEPGKLAAQKAFFQAALGQAAPMASAQTAASNPATMASAPVQRIPDPGAEKPQKILRPGSLLDIRI
jgi:hypothetical protein